MSPIKQKIAIAEACGWKYDKIVHAWKHESSKLMFIDCPDYLNSLDAMHEAEKTLEKEKMEKYCLTLHVLRIEQGVPTHDDGGWRNLGIVHATAAQRAEAFLKTIGKWIE